MADAQVQVELRLMLDKLRQDIARAAQEIRKGLAMALGGAGGGAGPEIKSLKDAGGVVEAHTVKVKRLTSELKAQKAAALEAWRAQFRAEHGEPKIIETTKFGQGDPGAIKTPAPENIGPKKVSREEALKEWKRRERQYAKDVGEIMDKWFPVTPEEGPGGGGAAGRQRPAGGGRRPPIIPPPRSIMQSPMFQTLATYMAQFMPGGVTATARAGAAGTRLAGAAGIGGAMGAVVGVAAAGVVAALLSLRKAVKETADAMERARRLYASSLQSGGMSVGFIAARQSLARILGVSEENVWQYAKAINSLDKNIYSSISSIAAATPTLTATAWRWQELKLQMDALWMTMGAKIAPAITEFIEGMKAVVTIMDKFNDKILLLAKVMTLGSAQSAALLFNSIRAMGRAAGNANQPAGAPTPEAWSRQLPVSAWERAGLVIGTGAENPNKTTAKNTTKMAATLDKIHERMREPRAPGSLWRGLSPFYNSP